MQPLNELVEDTLEEIRGLEQGSPVRLNRLDIVDAINEAKNLVVNGILRTRENFLAFVNNQDAPVDLTVSGGGEGRVELPVNTYRLIEVQIKVGSRFITIAEKRRGEGAAGWPRIEAGATEETVYYLLGRWLYFDPVPLNPTTVRLYFERYIPDLFMVKPASFTSTTFQLPKIYDKPNGERPHPAYDDLYNGHEVYVYEGTGLGQKRLMTDFAHTTGFVTVDSAFSPVLDATSKLACVTPFYGSLAQLNSLLKIRAAVVALTTKRQEDVSGWEARYNEIETVALAGLGSRTPGNRAAIPFDTANG